MISYAKLSPQGHSNHICDDLKCMKLQNLQGPAPELARGVHSTLSGPPAT